MLLATVLLGLYLFNLLPTLKEVRHAREHGAKNSHIRLAESFLQGRVDYDEHFYKDIAVFEGRYYSPFPPFPAVFLTPWVALLGPELPTMLLTPLLGALTALLLFELLRRLGVTLRTSLWATVAFVFGTVYWLMIREPYETYFAHVIGVLCAFSGLLLAHHQRHGVVIGFLLGAACLSRQLLAFCIPVAWVFLLEHRDASPPHRTRWRQFTATGIGLATCLFALLAYNYVRFGDPLEGGYRFIHEPGWYGTRLERWGVFHPAFMPSNFLRLFLLGFVIEFPDPHAMIPAMGTAGTSLTFASPFLFYAFWGRFADRRVLNWTGAACIILCLLVVLMNKNAMGAWQINGMRYALDFLPLLVLFAAHGMDRFRHPPYALLWKAAIVYAIVLNLLAIAIWYVSRYYGLPSYS